jgi:hypothetical protein
MIIAPRIEAKILDTNISQVEDGIAVYDSAATYVLKDLVQVNGATNRLYEALQDVPAGINPVEDVNATTGIGTYWFDRGATNYMRAFDELGSSKCSNADSIYYKFQISDTDILMIDGIESVASVRVVLTNNSTGEVILDNTDSLITRDVYDWFDWTYAATEFVKSYFINLPLIYDATLEVYLENTGSTVEVGHIAYGRGMKYGLSLINPAPVSSMRGITSKKRDAYGNIVTRRRARYKRMKITCIIDSKSVDLIEERLNALADTPAIFIGDERDGGYTALLMYGELKDHDMPISVSKTKYQLEVEGYL